MSYEIPGVVASFLSGSTTLAQYKVVRLSAANTVKHTTGVPGSSMHIFVLGVLQSVPAASTASTGQVCTVMLNGISKVMASSRAIAAGALLRHTSGAMGTSGGTVMTSSASTKHNIVGIALTSAAASVGASSLAAKARYISMKLR